MNKNFCIVPFTTNLVVGRGKVFPCCVTMNKEPLAIYDPANPTEHWHSPGFNQLRKDFLDGKKPDYCDNCWRLEETGRYSLRQDFLRKSLGDINVIASFANDDGSLTNKKPRYIESRSSNQCNYTCAYCDIASSSSWLQMTKELGEPVENISKSGYDAKTGVAKLDVDWTVYDLSEVREIVLHGGEPLLMDSTYKLLQHLIDINHTDVAIKFVTNGSKITYNNASIKKYIAPFKEVTFSISIDSMGDRHMYQRSGVDDWHKIEDNINTLLAWNEEIGNIIISFNATMTWASVYSWIDFVKKYQSVTASIFANYVDFNSRLSLEHLPDAEIHKIIDVYSKYPTDANPTRGMLSFCESILQRPEEERIKKLKEDFVFLDYLDTKRKKKFREVFPEWTNMIDDYKGNTWSRNIRKKWYANKN